MTGKISGHFKIVAVLGMAVTLTACENVQAPNFDFLKKKNDAEAGPALSSEAATPASEGIEREVEKPDVFSANEPALWDGRPSLGGVWVASPGVKDPERVIIRNLENGKSVVGALFRRERENPGPRLQLSSDAATELGVLAGAPTKLSVVALRTETIAPVAPAPVPEPVAVAVAEPEPVPTVTPLPKPEAATAIASAEASAPSELIPAADGPSDPIVAEPEPEEAAPVSSAMPSFFKRGARGAKATAANGFDAGTDAASTATAAAGGAAVETADVATSTLSPLEAAEAAIARADAEVAQEPQSRVAAAPAATAPAAVRPGKPNTSSFSELDKPFIQIGIFAVQANADRAGRRLNDAGVLPVILKQQSAGRTIWRVIVGPARTKSEGRSLQQKVRGLGYTDAYFVTD